MTHKTVKMEGRIRAVPRDFIVEEIWDDRICKISYSPLNRLRDALITRFQSSKEYLHFTLVKENWETIRALNYIRRRIGVSLRRFGIAGMKDKRAITAQRVSLWKGKAEIMNRLNLPDMILKDFEYADERTNLGSAVGNRFTITIRDVPKEESEVVGVLERFREIATSRGVPNYYGPQRLGGGNAEVGRAIKDGDLKLAVEVILKKVQSFLEEGGLETIPKVFWYEKRMLRHLKKYPRDYAGALRKIPKRIRRLYIHAYQSHIFNKKLRQALLEKRVPKTITVEGFSIPRMPELKADLLQRRSFLVVRDFKLLKIKNGTAKIQFTLSRGEYASTLLSHLLNAKV